MILRVFIFGHFLDSMCAPVASNTIQFALQIQNTTKCRCSNSPFLESVNEFHLFLVCLFIFFYMDNMSVVVHAFDTFFIAFDLFFLFFNSLYSKSSYTMTHFNAEQFVIAYVSWNTNQITQMNYCHCIIKYVNGRFFIREILFFLSWDFLLMIAVD